MTFLSPQEQSRAPQELPWTDQGVHGLVDRDICSMRGDKESWMTQKETEFFMTLTTQD